MAAKTNVGWLDAVIVEHELTNEQVAAACDVSETTIRRLRVSSRRPTRSTAANLRRGLRKLTGADFSIETIRGAR